MYVRKPKGRRQVLNEHLFATELLFNFIDVLIAKVPERSGPITSVDQIVCVRSVLTNVTMDLRKFSTRKQQFFSSLFVENESWRREKRNVVVEVEEIETAPAFIGVAICTYFALYRAL